MKYFLITVLLILNGTAFSQSNKEERKQDREQKKVEKERYRVLEAQKLLRFFVFVGFCLFYDFEWHSFGL